MNLTSLYSIVTLPYKYQQMEFAESVTDGKVTMTFSGGAILLVPIWPPDIYTGALLPYFSATKIIATQIATAKRTRDATKTYKITMHDTVDVLIFAGSESATIVETYPDLMTP